MNYYIDQQSQLDKLAPLLQKISQDKDVVAVDTEFVREKTFSAKLCLVQLGIGEDQYCVDVLAIEDQSLLVDLFADRNVTKLLHAARQDMEVIFQTLGVIPKPIFDTQVAAAFCGMDMQIGYAALVSKTVGVELAKTQSRTDWSRRPLSKEQLEYAGEDVAYLKALYEAGQQALLDGKKQDWYQQEIQTLYDKEKYQFNPQTAHHRFPAGSLSLPQQYYLRAVIQWREEQAYKSDIPRTWIAKDDALYDLAIQQPDSVEKIVKMRVFGKRSVGRFGKQVIELLQQTPIGKQPLWEKIEPLSKADKVICNGMMKQLRAYSEEYSIAQALLANRRDIEALYRKRQSEKLLHGWRKGLVGERLLVFIENAVQKTVSQQALL